MATKKLFKPEATTLNLTNDLVNILSTHFSNVVREDGGINQYMFTTDMTVGDMFDFLKECYPLIWSEYLAIYYSHRNGNEDDVYLEYLAVQLNYAAQREFVEHYRENRKPYKRTTKKK